jgi:hypothetical protein
MRLFVCTESYHAAIITDHWHLLFILIQQYTSNGCKDITGDFPVGERSGASSAISLDHMQNWQLFEKKNFDGRSYTMQPGERCPDFVKIGFNDKIKSVAKE